MTKRFEQEDSGLILPQEKPKLPKRKYGVLEIQDEDRRELAAKALTMLWEAMDLKKGDRSILPGFDAATYHAHQRLYDYAGEMLLGKDYPVGEVWT
jgi:hypothetical protein